MNPSSVQVVEVAPRDGLQNEVRHLGTEHKVELVARAVRAGARRVEVTGFARPDVVPALADAEDLVAALPDVPGVEYSALVVNERSYQRAQAAGVRAVNLVVLASETFSVRNQRRSTAEMLAETARIGSRCVEDGVRLTVTVGAAFGCPFEGEVPVDRLRAVLAGLADAGAQEVALADTIGVGTPVDVRQRFAALAEVLPRVAMRGHFHDTRSTGVANAVAAYEVGVRALDTSLAGIGGCPFAPAATGNLATEDLVYCFERMGVDTGLDLAALIDHADWLVEVLGSSGSSSVRRAGGFPAPTAAGAVR